MGHKRKNTFHYESFTKRIEKIGGDAVKWSTKLAKASDATESFLLDALTKWNDMDHGQDYIDFFRDLPVQEMQTCAQLLHHKDTIMEVIIKYLKTESSKSRLAFVEILMGAIRDFRESFDDHLFPVLETLLNVADEQSEGPREKKALGSDTAGEVQLIEALFLSVTLINRLYSDKLIKEYKKTYSMFLPLLGSPRYYLRRFSSEALSVLLRKMEKLDKFAHMAINNVDDDRLVDGISLLFFHTLRGTNKQLHSRAHQKITQLLSGSLSSDASDDVHDRMMSVWTKVMEQLAAFAAPTEMARVIKAMMELSTTCEGSRERLAIWQLIGHTVTRSKMLKKDPSEIAQPLLDGLRAAMERDRDRSVDYAELLPHLALVLWHAPAYSTALVAFLISLADWLESARVGGVLRQLTTLDRFDVQIMPILGKLAAKEVESTGALSTDTIALYADLCQERRPLSELWQGGSRVPFFNTSDHTEAKKAICRAVEAICDDDRVDEEVARMLVVWPWMYSTHETPTGMAKVQEWIRSRIDNRDSVDLPVEADAQLVLIAMTSLFIIDPTTAHGAIDKQKLFAFVRSHNASDAAIRVLWLWLRARDEWSSETEADELCDLLGESLLSGRPSVRKAILECLSPFKLNLPPNEDGVAETESAFSILLTAEREVLNLEGYRSRLMYLRKLSYPYHKRHIPVKILEKTEHMILRVLLSQLMERFTPLWTQVYDIVATFAKGQPIDDFWKTMGATLEMVAKKIRDAEEAPEHSWYAEIVQAADEMKPDYILFRVQLFRLLSTTPDIAERRTKILTPIVLSIYQRDYLREEEAIAEEANETDYDEEEEGEGEGEEEAEAEMDEDEDMDQDHEEEEEKTENKTKEEKKKTMSIPKKKKTEKRLGKRAAVQMLTAGLELFAKFSDLKSIYKEKQFRAMLDELLLCVELQKPVLACLFAYKIKALAPYKENFERLTGEKTFRDELALFTVDDDNSAIDEGHRAEVIPIFLRIVLGMLKSSAKAHVIRKTALMNAIAGCRSEELTTFLSILFAPIMPQLGNADTDPLLEKVRADISEHLQQISLPRTGWAIRSVSKVLARLAAALSPSDQSMLLRLLLTASVLVELARVHFPLKALKQLRGAIADALTQYFKSFPARPLAAAELTVLCKHFLQVGLEHHNVPQDVIDATLPTTVIVAPLATIKLIVSWTSLPPLYSLLNTRCIATEGALKIDGKKKITAKGAMSTPFQLMCSSLIISLRKRDVVTVLRTAFSNLLTYADELQTMPDLPQVDLPELEQKGGVNTGTRLMVQQLPFVLAFLLNTIEQGCLANTSTDLEMLARLSAFIESPSHRSRFAAVLLKQAIDKPRDTRLPTILSALANFTPTLEQPRALLRSITPLFSSVDLRPSRESLASVLRGLGANERLSGAELRALLTTAADLNSWDGRKVDEMDYEKRHLAYNTIEKFCRDTTKIDSDLVALLAHDDVHALRTIDDVALRAAAADALQELIKAVGRSEVVVEAVEEPRKKQDQTAKTKDQTTEQSGRMLAIDKTLAPLIIHGFGHKDQVVRDEFMRAFAVLVSAVPDHPKIGPLGTLRSDDEEADFFQNIVHIQSHRRQRAMWRLAEMIEGEKTSISTDSLLRYIIPLVQQWFVLTQDVSNSALSDEALRVLSAVLSKSEWKRYIAMLDYWLRRLTTVEQRKPIVRVIVAIVDAFHYDISDEGSSIRKKVLNRLLPSLKSCVDSKEAQSVHKKAASKKYYNEEDDIQRAPVALATAKLLLKLPQSIMDEHLHGLVLKMCSLLGSRSDRVRTVARKTLVSMAETLGPKYLSFILKELKLNLTRGYKVHVMIYTIHTLLSSMQTVIGHGDVDSAIDEVVEACCEDLFGLIADEKKVGAIREATMEAKQSKSLDTLALMSRFISSASMGRLLRPLEEALDNKPDAATHKIVGTALKEIAMGLKKNEGMDHRELLIYVYHQMTTNLDKIKEKETEWERVGQQEEEQARNPESCLILPKAPKRVGAIEKTKKGHAPVLLEFGLHLLAAVLSTQSWKEDGDAARLDPFLAIVMRAMELKYEKVATGALRCVQLLLPRELPSLQSNIGALADRLFVLLSTYAGFVSGKGTGMALNQMLFKTFSLLIKYSKEEVLGGKRIEILLSYVHSDLLETNKQATAFALLKSIVQREIRHPELKSIMRRVEEMSIQSEIDYVRGHCRQLLTQFIGSHPDGKKVESHVNFLLAQLDYETEEGRLSAIDTLHSLFGNLVQSALDPVGLTCVIRLASRLVSEPNEKGRAMSALAMRRLLANLSESRKNDAFLAAMDWLQNEKDGIRAAGASLLLQFCLMEGGGGAKEETDKKRLMEALTAVANSLDVTTSSFSPRTIVILLDSLAAIIGILGKEAVDVEGLLQAYVMASKWIKSSFIEAKKPACVLLGNLLALGPHDTAPDAWSLFGAAVWPLSGKKATVDEDLARVTMRNVLVTVERLNEDEVGEACEKLAKIARFEIINAPNESIKRSSCFKMAGAMALKMDGRRMELILDHFVPLLAREMSRKSSHNVADELSALAQEVVEVLKKRAGDRPVADRMIAAQKETRQRSESRKSDQKRLAAIDPEAAAAATMSKQKRKHESKKRKLDKMNINRVWKRLKSNEDKE